MLWCLPHLQFPNKRRRKSQGSTPVKEEMHMHPQDVESESGVYYVVPNKNRQGKTIVRRPLPPPTSTPLDEDFDAATQGGTTTRGPATEWGGRIKGSGIAGSSSPLDDDFDAYTYTAAPKSPSVMAPGSPNRPHGRNGPQSPTSGSGRYGGNHHSEGFETYGEYGQYLERVFGENNAEAKLSVQRLGRDQERSESPQIGRASNGHREGLSKGVIGRPSRLGTVGRGTDMAGPRAGQVYEMVNRKVLEDGPERTVTIATWREQVANETSLEGGIDVYYVGADEYGIESEERRVEVGSRANRRGSTPTRRTNQESQSASSPGSSGSKTDPTRGVRSSPERHMTPRKTSGQTYWSHANVTNNENNQADISGSSVSRNRPLPRTPTSGKNARQESRSRSPTLGKTKNGVYSAENLPPRSSTPVRRGASPQPLYTPARVSTPSRTPTFHPTDSGSTISTIKSASTIAFEKVLSSCEPPLLHISPALVSLGIATEGHLRAVARLTEETRDREVKEEVLKQGVTVMEWAILLDKLQTL